MERQTNVRAEPTLRQPVSHPYGYAGHMLCLQHSPHGRARARQRAGWSRQALERMLENVVCDGLGAAECAGALHRYLANLPQRKPARFVRVYGEHIFVFGRESTPDVATLVTVLHLPHAYRPAARRAREMRRLLAA